MAVKLWIENGFHNAPRFHVKPTRDNGRWRLSSMQVERANRKLCGVRGCTCGGIMGSEVRCRLEGVYADPTKVGIDCITETGGALLDRI